MFNIISQKLSIKDKEYPSNFFDLPDPPEEIYIKGNFFNYSYPKVAIVGSRKASSQALNFTHDLAKQITEHKVMIISGGAAGVDTAAHSGALANPNGKTIAVLGNGINVVYPKENKILFENISANGALISEFPPDAQPINFNFPKRNRLIAALADVVIIIQASIKSGALYTAKWAIKLKKKIGVVPGEPWKEDNQGGLNLLKEHKFIEIITNYNDVLKMLWPEKIWDSIKTSQNTYKPDHFSTNRDEQLLIELLKGNELFFDEIVEKLKIDPQKLSSLLIELELKNIIKDIGGHRYQLT